MDTAAPLASLITATRPKEHTRHTGRIPSRSATRTTQHPPGIAAAEFSPSFRAGPQPAQSVLAPSLTRAPNSHRCHARVKRHGGGLSHRVGLDPHDTGEAPEERLDHSLLGAPMQIADMQDTGHVARTAGVVIVESLGLGPPEARARRGRQGSCHNRGLKMASDHRYRLRTPA